MGVTVVDTMQKILAGEKVPEIILTPSVVVTPENLADYLAGKLWTEPVAGAPETDNNMPTVPEAETKPAEKRRRHRHPDLWHGWTGTEAETLAEIVKTFEAANPGAKIDLLAVPFDQLKNKFTTEASTGGGPDLLIGPKDWIGELAQPG